MAFAALNQQLLRGMPSHQQLPAHMLPFSPLLYPYQLAMAQAASGKYGWRSILFYFILFLNSKPN